jgi:hypothetical protein
MLFCNNTEHAATTSAYADIEYSLHEPPCMWVPWGEVAPEKRHFRATLIAVGEAKVSQRGPPLLPVYFTGPPGGPVIRLLAGLIAEEHLPVQACISMFSVRYDQFEGLEKLSLRSVPPQRPLSERFTQAREV